MSWGIWNKELKGWVSFNNVVFHAPSKAVCVAQINLLKRMMEQQVRMKRERERAQQAQGGITAPQLVMPGKDGTPIPVGPAVWEPITLPPSPFEPRTFEKWYQEELEGQTDG